ncbi:MAG: recombination mediator RecR [Patescibacteria group bacterium]|nr:recombination mediator RecR [Patescibacteria group bacterium]
MTNFLPKSVRSLIEEFSKLPGIGPKSAERLTMYLLHSPHSKIEPLGRAVMDVKKGIEFCRDCWNIAEENPCAICSDRGRDHSIICVVEEILDVVAIERTGEYKGLYHVLHGHLSPVDGIGPEELKIRALEERVSKGGVQEVILATNPGLEGETTALYLLKFLNNVKGLKVTRIARGLPIGGDLEYADEQTLTKALQGRAEY